VGASSVTLTRTLRYVDATPLTLNGVTGHLYVAPLAKLNHAEDRDADRILVLVPDANEDTGVLVGQDGVSIALKSPAGKNSFTTNTDALGIFQMNIQGATRSRLGLTATPPAHGSAGAARLAELVGPVVCEVGLRELQGTHLAELAVVRFAVKLDPAERAAYERAYRPFSMLRAAFVSARVLNEGIDVPDARTRRNTFDPGSIPCGARDWRT
jgi:hypothetical protein